MALEVERQRKIAEQIADLSEELKNSRNEEERKIISSQIESLKNYLKNTNKNS